MIKYFPGPKLSGGRVKVELDLSNYTTKADYAIGIDTSKFAKKVDLVSLKSNADKLDIDKLKNVPTSLNNLKSNVDELDVDKLVPVPVDLSNLGDVVKSDVVKKDVSDAKIKNIEDKIPDITNLATNKKLNAKINESINEMTSITNLATPAAFTAAENKIPNINDLVKKTDYDAKISEMEKKYFTTSDYNKFTSNTLDAKITQKSFLMNMI